MTSATEAREGARPQTAPSRARPHTAPSVAPAPVAAAVGAAAVAERMLEWNERGESHSAAQQQSAAQHSRAERKAAQRKAAQRSAAQRRAQCSTAQSSRGCTAAAVHSARRQHGCGRVMRMPGVLMLWMTWSRSDECGLWGFMGSPPGVSSWGRMTLWQYGLLHGARDERHVRVGRSGHVPSPERTL